MAPGRSRHTLLRFTFALSIITYIDRVCISSAAPAIREDLGLTAVQMGWVFSAFTFAYAVFEVPSGWLGDVIGPRKVLIRIVLWWSAFTAASGAAWNFASLLATRFLFGVGEAGAFPNMSRSFRAWFPARERGTAHGVVFLGSRLGAAVAPPLVVVLIAAIGWRAAFAAFGGLGVAWAVLWWRWFRDDPADHPSVTADELAAIRSGEPENPGVPFRAADLLDSNLLRVCLMYFCVGYGLYFYLTWLPTYFKEARGFSTAQAAMLASVVLTASGIATFAGGWLTDVLVRRYGLKAGRSIGGVAMPASAAFILAAAFVPNPMLAAGLMALAAGAADLCLSPSWSMCHDIGGDAAGAVTGAMNTLGNLGGAISPLVVGYSVQLWGSWTTPLVVTAVIYVIGGVLTLTVNPHRPLRAAGQGSMPLVSAS